MGGVRVHHHVVNIPILNDILRNEVVRNLIPMFKNSEEAPRIPIVVLRQLV